ncbi:hypothetical protein [Type-D symbiont of Plautia stali]|nr:hypothetical protein [Type-D symbiont of Plautia stali]
MSLNIMRAAYAAPLNFPKPNTSSDDGVSLRERRQGLLSYVCLML